MSHHPVADEQSTSTKRTSFLRKTLSQREATVFLIVLLVIVATWSFQHKFLNTSNIRSVALSVSTDGILSIGLCFALILGGIELSVGGVAAMTCVITGYLVLHGMNIWLAALAAMASGLAVGAFNGFMISKVGLPPFIVTLSMMNLSRGIAYILTKGSPLSLSGKLSNSFRFLATGNVGGVPMLFIIFCTLTILAFIMTKRSRSCRDIFYVGSNENAARLSGIQVDHVKIGVYIVIALLSSLAGILSLGRFNVATPELSKGAETTAISAAVIGGTSMAGGIGSILGTFMGIFLLKVVNSALVMLDVSVYWQNFVQGAILLVAVTLDYISHRQEWSGFPLLRARRTLPAASGSKLVS